MISVSICSPSMDVAAAWADLTKRALPNVFMNPAALTAANERRFAQVYVLLAWEAGGEPRKLVGVWALQIRKFPPFCPALAEALPSNYASQQGGPKGRGLPHRQGPSADQLSRCLA